MYYIFYLLFFLIIFISPATGDINTISGNIVNNQNFTLNGSFNTKTSSAPIRWETSESYELGSNLTDASGWWTHRLGYEDCTISNDKSRGVSSKSIKAEILGGLAGSRTPNIWKNNIGFASTGKVYINMWIWWDWGDLWQTAIDPYQIKTIGLAPSISDEGSPSAGFGGAFYLWWHILSGGYPVTCMYHYFDDFGTQCWTNNTVANSGYWINVTIMYDQGHSGLNDGKFYGYVLDNGVYKANAGNGIGKDFWSGSEAPYTELMNAIKIFNYVDLNDNESGRINLYYDDIYIDNSWSRVEVGDNPVYANCTHRELQPYLSWNNNQIVGNFNQGSFNVGDTVYFFVIDEENIPSPGVAAVIQDPSIAVSNVSIDNNILTISGYNFNSGPTVSLYDNFERGSNGETVSFNANIGSWTELDTNAPYYDNLSWTTSTKRGLSMQGGDTDCGEGATNCEKPRQIKYTHPSMVTEFYTSYWVMVPNGSYFPYTLTPETFPTISAWKMNWLSTGDSNIANDMIFPSWIGSKFNAGGNSGVLDPYTHEEDQWDSNYVDLGDENAYWAWGDWVRFTLYVKGNDADPYGYSGTVKVTAESSAGKFTFSDETAKCFLETYGYGITQWRFNGWMRSQGTVEQQHNVKPVYDEIYIATGAHAQARIEIGNAPIYSNCTHTELQAVTSWNDNQIQALLNKGTFSNEDTYVFVIDENGIPSAGCPIDLNKSIPVVTNVEVNESGFSINGGGFGTKLSQTQIHYDNFEDGEAGSSITSKGFWSIRPQCTAKYNTSNNRTGSSKNIKCDYGGAADEWFYKNNIGFETTGKAYVNMWLYFDLVSGDDSWMLKLWRLNSDGNDHTSRPLLGHTLFTNTQYPTKEWYDQFSGNRSDGTGFPNNFGTMYNNDEGVWINIALQYKTSDVDVSNGSIRTWVSCSTPNTPINRGSLDNVSIKTTGYTKDINAIAIGYLLETGGLEAYSYWDNAYIDNEWNRVEIGDNPIYDNCSHREIQPLLSWSNDRITGNFNQGSFNVGDTVYFFIVDSEGNVSNGYPFTIKSNIQSVGNAVKSTTFKQCVFK